MTYGGDGAELKGDTTTDFSNPKFYKMNTTNTKAAALTKAHQKRIQKLNIDMEKATIRRHDAEVETRESFLNETRVKGQIKHEEHLHNEGLFDLFSAEAMKHMKGRKTLGNDELLSEAPPSSLSVGAQKHFVPQLFTPCENPPLLEDELVILRAASRYDETIHGIPSIEPGSDRKKEWVFLNVTGEAIATFPESMGGGKLNCIVECHKEKNLIRINGRAITKAEIKAAGSTAILSGRVELPNGVKIR